MASTDRRPKPFPCHSPTTTITLPWTAPSFAAVKGIIHAPCAKPTMKAETREALLTAIAKAREWIDDIRLGRIASFAEIAEREVQGERHIRLLAPLPSCRLASLRRSLMEPRLRTSRSPASPRPCPIPGVSRSGASDCDVSPATHARRHRSRRRNRLKQTPNKDSLPAQETHRMSAKKSTEAVDFVPASA